MERVNAVLNVGLIVILTLMAFWPGGRIATAVEDFQSARRAQALIEEEWATLTRTALSDGEPALLVVSDYQCPF